MLYRAQTASRWRWGEHQSTFDERDGFFVGFTSASDALACAMAIQRALARHREDHGFAPHVRIGVHEGEATVHGGDFTGREVHLAARVSSVGTAGEIVVSADTGVAAGATGASRTIALKGFPEPVDVVVVDWSQ